MVALKKRLGVTKIYKVLIPLILVASLLSFGIVALASAEADCYDLTFWEAEDTVNGAIIRNFTPADSPGTGYWHSFLRLS